MTEDESQANEVLYQELLRSYREGFGGIREPVPDVDVEARRLVGYRDLFPAVFPHVSDAPGEQLLSDFRDAVNDALLQCIESDRQLDAITSSGDPQYRQGGVMIPTPRQAEAVILAFGLLDGQRQSAHARAKQANRPTSPFQRLINAGVRNIMESLIQGSFGETYPHVIPDKTGTLFARRPSPPLRQPVVKIPSRRPKTP